MTSLLERARGLEADLIALRRDFHRHPELSFREERTAAVIADRLRALGLRVRTGVGGTGVVAEIGGDGPVVALRADMDALPIQEASEHAYRSAHAGVMHACGHDAHMTMLLGAATLLAAQAAELRGTVRLLFQPAEEASDDENKSGATRVIEDGALEGVSAIFGLHIAAHLEAGRVFLRPGALMAGSDILHVTVEGESSHAGRPHEGVDAILLAAQAVVACQANLARRLAPFETGVLSIGTIEGGSAENILADRVHMTGTMRYFGEDGRAKLHAILRDSFGLCDAQGGRARVEILPNYPPVVNDDAMTTLAHEAIAAALGDDVVRTVDPLMWAEDFAILLRETRGAFFLLGAALDPPREHHHPKFDIDERVLPLGAAALAACARHALAALSER
ncbi:MAG TPA: M20 family metallopeptidase [Longimicrobiales bacterium]